MSRKAPPSEEPPNPRTETSSPVLPSLRYFMGNLRVALALSRVGENVGCHLRSRAKWGQSASRALAFEWTDAPFACLCVTYGHFPSRTTPEPAEFHLHAGHRGEALLF